MHPRAAGKKQRIKGSVLSQRNGRSLSPVKVASYLTLLCVSWNLRLSCWLGMGGGLCFAHQYPPLFGCNHTRRMMTCEFGDGVCVEENRRIWS